MNHYPRHVGDFIRDTVGLSLAERGAYTALLDQYYASEKPIAHTERYRITGAVSKADKAAVDYVMGRYFVEQADGWHQKRADKEIQAYRDRSASASASANARWDKRNANAMRTHSDGNANQEPVTSNQNQGVKRTTRASAKPSTTPLPTGFAISPRVQDWANKNGHQRLAERFEDFTGKARAKGYVYADWDEAFMRAVRDDWAKLGAANSDPRLTVVGQATAKNLERWIASEEAKDGTDGP